MKTQAISIPFNVAVLHIVSQVMPRGFDVSPDAPHDYDSLLAHYQETGRVCVWNGASSKTIFADVEVNYAFRAWHDSKHITRKLPFDRAGELAALAWQKMDVNTIYDGPAANLFCRLLDAEIHGQFYYNKKHGGFPVDQIGFTRAYLADASAAIMRDFGVSTTTKGIGTC